MNCASTPCAEKKLLRRAENILRLKLKTAEQGKETKKEAPKKEAPKKEATAEATAEAKEVAVEEDKKGRPNRPILF